MTTALIMQFVYNVGNIIIHQAQVCISHHVEQPYMLRPWL